MEEEKMILAHEADPAYRKAFYICIIVGFSYLGLIFLIYSG